MKLKNFKTPKCASLKLGCLIKKINFCPSDIEVKNLLHSKKSNKNINLFRDEWHTLYFIEF